MKRYIGELIEIALSFLCALSNHAHGCWLINSSPARRLYWWAVNLRWDDRTTQEAACPLCHFDRNQYVPTAQHREKMHELEAEIDALESSPCNGNTTGAPGAFAHFQYDARTGITRRVG